MAKVHLSPSPDSVGPQKEESLGDDRLSKITRTAIQETKPNRTVSSDITLTPLTSERFKIWIRQHAPSNDEISRQLQGSRVSLEELNKLLDLYKKSHSQSSVRPLSPNEYRSFLSTKDLFGDVTLANLNPAVPSSLKGIVDYFSATGSDRKGIYAKLPSQGQDEIQLLERALHSRKSLSREQQQKADYLMLDILKHLPESRRAPFENKAIQNYRQALIAGQSSGDYSTAQKIQQHFPRGMMTDRRERERVATEVKDRKEEHLKEGVPLQNVKTVMRQTFFMMALRVGENSFQFNPSDLENVRNAIRSPTPPSPEKWIKDLRSTNPTAADQLSPLVKSYNTANEYLAQNAWMKRITPNQLSAARDIISGNPEELVQKAMPSLSYPEVKDISRSLYNNSSLTGRLAEGGVQASREFIQSIPRVIEISTKVGLSIPSLAAGPAGVAPLALIWLGTPALASLARAGVEETSLVAAAAKEWHINKIFGTPGSVLSSHLGKDTPAFQIFLLDLVAAVAVQGAATKLSRIDIGTVAKQQNISLSGKEVTEILANLRSVTQGVNFKALSHQVRQNLKQLTEDSAESLVKFSQRVRLPSVGSIAESAREIMKGASFPQVKEIGQDALNAIYKKQHPNASLQQLTSLYDPSTRTVYILNKLTIAEKQARFVHEVGHHFLDKIKAPRYIQEVVLHALEQKYLNKKGLQFVLDESGLKVSPVPSGSAPRPLSLQQLSTWVKNAYGAGELRLGAAGASKVPRAHLAAHFTDQQIESGFSRAFDLAVNEQKIFAPDRFIGYLNNLRAGQTNLRPTALAEAVMIWAEKHPDQFRQAVRDGAVNEYFGRLINEVGTRDLQLAERLQVARFGALGTPGPPPLPIRTPTIPPQPTTPNLVPVANPRAYLTAIVDDQAQLLKALGSPELESALTQAAAKDQGTVARLFNAIGNMQNVPAGYWKEAFEATMKGLPPGTPITDDLMNSVVESLPKTPEGAAKIATELRFSPHKANFIRTLDARGYSAKNPEQAPIVAYVFGRDGARTPIRELTAETLQTPEGCFNWIFERRFLPGNQSNFQNAREIFDAVLKTDRQHLVYKLGEAAQQKNPYEHATIMNLEALARDLQERCFRGDIPTDQVERLRQGAIDLLTGFRGWQRINSDPSHPFRHLLNK